MIAQFEALIVDNNQFESFDMGWFGSTPTKVSAVSEYHEESRNTPPLLEDLPPKFEDKEPSHVKQPTLVDAFHNVKLQDFTIDNYIGMPCFREAMLTGFQAMGVLGVVTFLIHKNPSRSVNWGICGFFLGSIVGWEQCRSIRRKSFQTVEAAKQANQEKMLKKIEQAQNNDDLFKKFNDVQSKK